MGSGHLYNSISTQSREEGRSATPPCHGAATFQMPFLKKATLAKRNPIPTLTLGPTGILAAALTTRNGKGGGVIARHSGGVCALFVCALLPSSPPSTC